MKILYYDCFAGISGDMNLAAMIDLGVDPNYLIAELSSLSISQDFELEVYETTKNGIAGTQVNVNLHDIKQDEIGGHHHKHHHKHRHLADITKIIDDSKLTNSVKDTAKKIFAHVARAEAHVHGISIDKVHFHEVGAIDSIVDIVGAAICFHALNVDQVISRPVELGGGFIKCAHGLFPVPAPATAEILIDVPTTLGAVTSEATTPTGAAILKTLVDKFSTSTQFTSQRIGYGIGHRDCEIPNVLRVYLAK
ncbi:MAG: nickel pincer cofactor biosynthesis protein LarC [Desulfotalea sp.]